MATTWKSQQGDNKYGLQFDTDDKEKYKFVERAVQQAMDNDMEHDRETALAVLKEFSRDMYVDYDLFGHKILSIEIEKFEDIRKKFLDKESS